jgi:DNA replicative helicase MCM subunit Mcm2 (Cdc46/Mcm family)
MMDQPDAEVDKKLSSHLVKMHSVDQNLSAEYLRKFVTSFFGTSFL